MVKTTKENQDKLIWVKVGSHIRPASDADIEDARKIIKDCFDLNVGTIVVHHAFQVFTFDKSKKLLVNVGDEIHPAKSKDIQEMMKQIKNAKEKNEPLVTNHLVNINYLPF